MQPAARIGFPLLIALVMLAGCCSRRQHEGAPSFPSVLRMEPAAPADTRLRARWFGVSTLLLEDGETAILIDGFFSRPCRTKTLFTRIGPDEQAIRAALRAGEVSKIHAVLVTHSHYDHALDAPFVAKEKDALLAGSESALHQARAEGMTNDRLRLLRNGDRIRFGKFDVEVYQTPHSPTILRGANDESFEAPARFYDYKLGANYSFLLRHPEGNILVVPSAGYRAGMLREARADVVFLGIGGLGKQESTEVGKYWTETVANTHAKLVIPVHWDDFTQPFAEPLRPFPWPADKADKALAALTDRACRAGLPLRLMPLYRAVSLAGPSRQALQSATPPASCLSAQAASD